MHLTKIHYRVGAAAALVLLAWLTLFSVRETEFALITQFGRPVGTVTDAGLHAKWFFQSATYFDRRLRVYDPRPSEFLTRDKKNLVIESYVAWRIRDPQHFVETVGDPVSAEMRLHDIVWSGLSAVLGTHDLDAIVAPNPAFDNLNLLNTQGRYLTIRIIDLTGQTLLTTITANYYVNLDVARLATGEYILNVTDNNTHQTGNLLFLKL